MCEYCGGSGRCVVCGYEHPPNSSGLVNALRERGFLGYGVWSQMPGKFIAAALSRDGNHVWPSWDEFPSAEAALADLQRRQTRRRQVPQSGGESRGGVMTAETQVFGGAGRDGSPWAIDMTLRDWFAGQALAGLSMRGGSTIERDVSDAYAAADAMMRERGLIDLEGSK